MSPGSFHLRDRAKQRLATVFTTAGALAALSTAVVAFFGSQVIDKTMTQAIGVERWQEAASIAAKNDELNRQIVLVNKQLDALRPNIKPNDLVAAELISVKAAVADLSKRQKRIEDAISKDPARALEIPLMRRDLDNIKESNTQAIEGVKANVSQIFDLNKWLLGGGCLSLFAIALGTVLARWKLTSGD